MNRKISEIARHKTLRTLILGAWVLATIPMPFFVYAEETSARNALKVCADPYMLPFSSQEQPGYENRIAELFAKKLGMEIEYTWFPQRMGFIRNTLRKETGTGGEYACDLVVTVPDKFDLAATTEPYYTTSYMLVYVKGRGLDEVTDPQMLGKFVADKKPDLKFGLADQGPAQLWVFYQGLMGNMVPFQGQPGDPKVTPGKLMLDQLVSGTIDVTIIWGPTAGYYAREYHDNVELVMLPMKDDPQNAEMKFVYNMSMAVRFGEKEWKDQINQLIKDNRQEIMKILSDYSIPLIEP